ncbi:MAG TPA: glycosyltransferase [Planctomycetota bacterium]|nr:glycosyltransferase [Planctomycetota bacterium]
MTAPLHVLYLVPSLAAGGAERVVIEHLRRLPRERFAPELAVFRAGGPRRAEVPADVAVHEIRGPGLLARGLALRRLLEERRIEVVSSHLAHANVVNLAASPRRVARVTTVHADRRGIEHAGLRSRYLMLLQRALARRADRIVFLCPETAAAMARAYGARPAQVAVVPNGVDPDELRGRADLAPPPAWPAGGLRVLAAGRLAAQKGFDLLLRAFAIARGRGLDGSLLILGEGEERAALERLRGELRLERVVALPGHAGNPYPAMRHADMFVLSSRYEGFPLVLLEALALGLPALATACPAGPFDLLGEGAGLLLRPHDPGALADGLLALAADPARRADLSRRGTERAQQYRWAAVIDRVAALLEVPRTSSDARA